LKSSFFEKIKRTKPFEKSDIFIYLALVIVIAILFIFFVIIPTVKKPNGFAVYKNGKTVLTFSLDDKKLEILSDFIALTDVDENENGITIIVYENADKLGYNTIYIDKKNRTAKVIDSNCSNSKECVHSPTISNTGAIFCAPRGLKITPISGDEFLPPIVG
jgi:hypothetical protein